MVKSVLFIFNFPLQSLPVKKLKKRMSDNIGSKVEVFNKDTLETHIYPSISKAAEALARTASTIGYYIKNNKPFKGKYYFKKIDKKRGSS